MIALWLVAALLSAAAAALILHRAARAGAVGGVDPTAAVYERQLSEIDELAERGLLAETERRSARAEAARRLLSAADQEARPEPAAGRPAGRRAVVLIAAGAPLLAVSIYLAIGSPQYADQPFSKRLAEWRAADPATLDPERMVALLQAATAERPGDPQALYYLARAQAASGDMVSAVRSLQKAVALAPSRADLWTAAGEALVAEAGGEIGPDAKAAFRRAVALDPAAPSARYHLARANLAAGDVAAGLAEWRRLAAELPAGDPRRAGLEDEIAAVVRDGGLKPAAASAAAVPEEAGAQQAFIRSMVDGLAARLKAQPDDPQGWARLVRSYGVLGDKARRDAALAEARRLFAGRPDALKVVESEAGGGK